MTVMPTSDRISNDILLNPPDEKKTVFFPEFKSGMNFICFLLTIAVGFLLFTITGCKPNDLGTECVLERSVLVDGKVVLMEVPLDNIDRSKDYVSTGAMECEHFTCVLSARYEDKPYCTRPCFSDDQCQGGVNPYLVCRELVLDDKFIEDLCKQIGPERCEEIFGHIRGSKYCADPLPEN